MSQTLNLIRAIGRSPQAPLMYRFLREFGTAMEVVRDCELTGSMPLGHCFKNSYRVVDARDYVYCEGLAVPKKIMPMEHAWVLDEGQFLDPTWSDGTDYVGVAFRTDWLRQHLMKTGVYGVFCNLHALRRPPSWVYEYLKEGLYA